MPWYSEACSSTLATTYSSGNQNEKQIVSWGRWCLRVGAGWGLRCWEQGWPRSATLPPSASLLGLSLV